MNSTVLVWRQHWKAHLKCSCSSLWVLYLDQDSLVFSSATDSVFCGVSRAIGVWLTRKHSTQSLYGDSSQIDKNRYFSYLFGASPADTPPRWVRAFSGYTDSHMSGCVLCPWLYSSPCEVQLTRLLKAAHTAIFICKGLCMARKSKNRTYFRMMKLSAFELITKSGCFLSLPIINDGK